MKIISRDEAIEQNLKRFFTGVPCKKGHISERYVAGGTCIECQRETTRAYRESIKTGYPRGRPRIGEVRPPSANAVKMSEYRKRRLAREPEWREELAQQARKWRENNPERAREIQDGVNQRKKDREKS